MKNTAYRQGGACQNERREGCGCGFSLPVLALLPAQQLDEVFEPETGFWQGTIFPELVKPFEAGRCGR